MHTIHGRIVYLLTLWLAIFRYQLLGTDIPILPLMLWIRMPSLKTTSFKGCPAWFHRRGQLLRSHDLWHGRGGGVRCYRPTTNQQQHEQNIARYFIVNDVFFEKPCFLRGSLLLPLWFDYFFFGALRGVHIFAVWQPFFCRQ